MKHTKQLIASLIVIALLCIVCSAGIGRGTPSNDFTGSNSSTAGSQAQSLSVGGSALPYTDIANVDIMDEDGSTSLPVVGGTNFWHLGFL